MRGTCQKAHDGRHDERHVMAGSGEVCDKRRVCEEGVTKGDERYAAGGAASTSFGCTCRAHTGYEVHSFLPVCRVSLGHCDQQPTAPWQSCQQRGEARRAVARALGSTCR
jgi:hypothetical protein